MGQRKEPRWVTAFLRALERTGEARTAATDAGIDHTTAYARRRGHEYFAEAWDVALERWRSAQAQIEFDAVPPATPLVADPASRARSEDFAASGAAGGAQIKRVGEGRWTPAAERRFFDELAASANVKRAAAAGVSANAVYARRMKQPAFRAKWAAVLETGRAAIEMKLVEAASRSFDPDDIDTGAIEPRVSATEAIRIVQLHGTRDKRTEEDQSVDMSDEDVAALRERLIRKLQRLREREMPSLFAEGWSLDDAHDQLVPPGWVRSSD